MFYSFIICSTFICPCYVHEMSKTSHNYIIRDQNQTEKICKNENIPFYFSWTKKFAIFLEQKTYLTL